MKCDGQRNVLTNKQIITETKRCTLYYSNILVDNYRYIACKQHLNVQYTFWQQIEIPFKIAEYYATVIIHLLMKYIIFNLKLLCMNKRCPLDHVVSLIIIASQVSSTL
uniref:Uncharacterized protein n=1 Tax=Schistocephalus solidus TaxID=70667 RepID=A0A0X3NNQ9_SCHSO